MLDADGAPIPGRLCPRAGRGGEATGGIGANKLHAIETVERFLDDVVAERLPRPTTPPDAFDALLRPRRVRAVVNYRGITAIDRREQERGELPRSAAS